MIYHSWNLSDDWAEHPIESTIVDANVEVNGDIIGCKEDSMQTLQSDSIHFLKTKRRFMQNPGWFPLEYFELRG